MSGEAELARSLDPPDWEQKLRAVFADTRLDDPRPLTRFELWDRMESVGDPNWEQTLRHAAVLVPVVARPQGPTVLLTLRSNLLRNHSGQVSFPGGRRDPGDRDLVETALREAEEEIGLPRQAVKVIGYLDDYPTTSRYRVTPVIGWVADLPPLRGDASEVAEIFEVPLSQLLDADNYEQKIFIRDGLHFPIYEVRQAEHRIWGATAGMLWDFCSKVKAWTTR